MTLSGTLSFGSTTLVDEESALFDMSNWLLLQNFTFLRVYFTWSIVWRNILSICKKNLKLIH